MDSDLKDFKAKLRLIMRKHGVRGSTKLLGLSGARSLYNMLEDGSVVMRHAKLVAQVDALAAAARLEGSKKAIADELDPTVTGSRRRQP